MSEVSSQELAGLVGKLDLPGKVRLLTGASMFTLHGDPSVGLDAMAFSDGPTGVRGLVFTGEPVACLPNATLLASSWRAESAREVGALLAEEAQRQRVHVVLGPTVNLHRSALGGRLFEAYSEDPLLTGVLAAAYVEGLQGAGTGACLKHLVANEAETERHTVDSRVDERTLRELYLLPFEIAVSDADPWAVMAAYNDVNGVPATEQDHVNNGVLKGEWGWTGLLMSDWFATKSAGPAANGGLDLVMPGPEGPWGDALVAAVSSGEVEESVVDEHVVRLLRLAGRVGALGEARDWPSDLPAPDAPERREQLTRLAAEGMTVLTNDGTLPLRDDSRVVVVGRHAVETVVMGGGSAQVNPPYAVSVAQGLEERLGAVRAVDGVEVRSRPRAAALEDLTDPTVDQPGMHLLAVAADGTVLRDEHLSVTEVVVGLDDDLAQPVAAVTLTARVAAGKRRIGVLGAGSVTLHTGEQVDRFRLDLETGDVGEAILRPPAWTHDVELVEDTTVVAELDLSGVPGAKVGLVGGPTPRSDDELLDDAVAAAGDAEVAVVVVGLSEEQETEAIDKTTLALPGRQDELVRRVAAVAARTVVVVNAATPVLMPWLDDVSAVMWAGLPGQEAGRAVAAALLGDIEPAGRLVTTFPREDGAAPAWQVVPDDGVLSYDEGVWIGYRGHAAGRAPAPAFWFGHGLGYATWDYADPQVETTGPAPRLSVALTNTSSVDSREVVQVYFDPEDPDQPVRLAGWASVAVAAGSTVAVDVSCDARMWRTWDDNGWRTLTGGRLLVARGLGDVRLDVPLPSADNQDPQHQQEMT